MLLWRKAGRVWRGKGYTHTSAADALEAELGKNKGFSRSKVGLLVTTQFEPCPPKVEDFILNKMKVLDEEKWAEYLREAANEPPEDAAAPPLVSAPREVREVAREAAAEVADVARVWLEAFGSKLEAFMTGADAALSGMGNKLNALASSVRGQLDSTNGKLDQLQATLNHEDARFDLAELQREKDKREIIRAVRHTGGIVGGVVMLGVAALMQCPHAQPAAPAAPVAAIPAQHVTINVGPGQGVAGVAASTQQAGPYDRRTPGIGGDLGDRKIRLMPHQHLPKQAVSPCLGSERTLYGACWRETKDTAPCPPDQYQEGESCYVPVHEEPKQPASESSAPPTPVNH